jgi:hypothetical protein
LPVSASRGLIDVALSYRAGDHHRHHQEHSDRENGAQHGEVVAEAADQRWPPRTRSIRLKRSR